MPRFPRLPSCLHRLALAGCFAGAVGLGAGCEGGPDIGAVVLLAPDLGEIIIEPLEAVGGGLTGHALAPDPSLPVPSAEPPKAAPAKPRAPRIPDAPPPPTEDTRPDLSALADGYGAAGGGGHRRSKLGGSRSGGSAPGKLAMLSGEVLPSAAGDGPAASLTRAAPEAPVKPLTDADVQAAVRRQMPRVRACYERALKSTPGLGGTLRVAWTVTPAGDVEAVEVVEDGPGSAELTACALRSIGRWHFPKGAEEVDVEYPFTLRPSAWGAAF